jgi:hypothetical protein
MDARGVIDMKPDILENRGPRPSECRAGISGDASNQPWIENHLPEGFRFKSLRQLFIHDFIDLHKTIIEKMFSLFFIQ